MATSTPAPNSSPSAVPPAPNSSPSAVLPAPTLPPPPQQLAPPPAPPTSPPPGASSPPTIPTPSPPLQSPPSTNSTAPPPSSPPPPQQPVASPPPTSTTSPPPPPVSSPPPVNSSPPISNSPSPLPPTPSPPQSSPPPPSPNPPASSPPPSSPNPPARSPPPRPSNPPSNPPQNSPPPSPPRPPRRSPPPPSLPPQIAAPPPDSPPPQNSSPPSPANPPPPPSPANPPPPESIPPVNSPPPSINHTLPASPSSSNSPPNLFPPPPRILASPPPPSGVSPGTPPSLSPPSPSQLLVPPSGNPTNNEATGPNAPSGNGGISTGVAVAIGIVLGLALLSVIGVAAWCMRKKKKKSDRFNGGYVMPTSLGSSPASDSGLIKVQISPAQNGNRPASGFIYSPAEPGGLGNSRSWFTYEELVEATNGFSAENLLGEGGFGSVYKGYLADGTEIAVKQLKIGGGQGEREFKAEVEIISRIHHRHLVSLVGYCISDNRRLLVYDYVPNNTLYFHLHGTGRPVMDWATRIKVAAGAARGIAYLHEDCHPRIIHRDIKSSNILLDNNFEARVSDFGLAKLAVEANTHITTRVMGTFGYMAPEYASSGKLTEKSDVYSFGVVLLELVTGRKPVDASQPLGEESLVEWARPLLSQALDTEEFEVLADPRLEKNYVESEMFRMIEAAAACVRHSAAKRPRMGQIVRSFDNMAAADLTNGMRLGESEIFNSAQQSAEIRLFRRMAFGSQDYSTDFFSQGSLNNN